ncbi:DnaD domain protein [Brotaphodocola catenula]
MDLTCKFQIEATMVANEFIDRYMADANGEYVKVYLYLLRHASEKLDVGTIADALNHTEADVKRAVLYWQKVGAVKGATALVGPKNATISARKSGAKSVSSSRARKSAVLTMEDLFASEDQEPPERERSAGSGSNSEVLQMIQSVQNGPVDQAEDSLSQQTRRAVAVEESSSVNTSVRSAVATANRSESASQDGGKFTLGTRGFQMARPSLGGLSALFGEVPIEQVRENSARVIGQRRGLEVESQLSTQEEATPTSLKEQENQQAQIEPLEQTIQTTQTSQINQITQTEPLNQISQAGQANQTGQTTQMIQLELLDLINQQEEHNPKEQSQKETGESSRVKTKKAEKSSAVEPERENLNVGEGMRTSGIWGREPRIRDAVPIASEGSASTDPLIASLLSAKPEEEGAKETEKEEESLSAQLENDEEFSQLLYIAQRYLNRIFTPRDVDIFANLYEGLHLSAEMLEYLVEYCVQNGHTSVRYIEAVGMNWHEKGFQTVEEAKAYSTGFTKDSFAVMRAFGLNDRKPGDGEREMIEKWFKTYGFSRELVIEACRRTMEATHKPSFRYADKILSDWREAGVKSMEDVNQIDEKRRTTQSTQNRQSPRATVKAPVNRFHNFEQRSTDYDSLVLDQVKGWLGEQ